MHTKNSISVAGINTTADAHGTWHWRMSSETVMRSRRFAQFIRDSLIPSHEHSLNLPALLVGLDGVAVADLEAIDSQNSLPYLFDESIYLEWESRSPPRTERRQLSSLTSDSWPINRKSSSRKLSDLKNFLGTCASYANLPNAITELAYDQICWWLHCLPGPLFSHLANKQVLSALPRTALARLQAKQTIVTLGDPNSTTPKDTTDLGLTSDLLDSVDISQGLDRSAVILQLARTIFTSPSSTVDGITKRSWAVALTELKLRAESEGPWTAMLLAWGVHLCEHGTVSELDPAASTVKKYFTQASLPLFELLKNLPLSMDDHQWKVEVIQDQYRAMVVSQSTGNQKTMASALVNFHSFLVEYFDVAPLPRGLHRDVAEPRVKAHVVWPHETALANKWLDQVEDSRLQNAARIILSIATECPVRSHELLRLTLQNIQRGRLQQGEVMEIEIARNARRGRLKRPASQRRLTLTGRETMSLIEGWMIQRFAEGAPSTAYLFGDPTDDTLVYKPASTLALVNRLLKAATGDRDISLHTLRHTTICQKLSECLLSSSIVDVNRFALVAAQAGHASPSTTFANYFHTYETALRFHLNEGLCRTVSITSRAAQHLLGIRAATLRQKASRGGQNLPDFVWKRILSGARSQAIDSVDQIYSMALPQPPAFSISAPLSIAPSVLLDLLILLTKKAEIGYLGMRFGLSEIALGKSIAELIQICMDLVPSVWPRRLSAGSLPVCDLRQTLDHLGIDLGRALQLKYQELRNYLCAEPADQELLRSAILAWKCSFFRGFLRLDDQGQVINLYRLLKVANVEPYQLRICFSVATEKGLSISEKCELAIVEQDFQNCFGLPPRISLVQFRLGRPRAYLLWDSFKDSRTGLNGDASSSASASPAGLHAWMIVAQFYMCVTGSSE